MGFVGAIAARCCIGVDGPRWAGRKLVRFVTFLADNGFLSSGHAGAGISLAGSNTIHGPIFGDALTGLNRYRGALTDKQGGYATASRDIDYLAALNNVPVLGSKGTVTGPPAGWRLLPTRSGVIVRNLASGLQLRVSGGRVHIDIRAGTRVGTGSSDISWHGEVIHYVP